MKDFSDLLLVLTRTRRLLALPENDFSGSSWENQEAALDEIDSHIRQIEAGSLPEIEALFAPTGPIQEVSLSSGWRQEFIALSDQFDAAWARK